jgi:5-methylthioadenosine/S-adenosylhomocysteine deaminase
MILTGKILVPITSLPVGDSALLIDEGKIVAIGHRDELIRRYPQEEIRDYPHGVILPGLINLHTHLEYTALGDLRESVPFLAWLDSLILRSKILSRGDWEESYQKGIGELKRCGVTMVVDIARWGVGLDALIASGLRGIYCIEFVAVDDQRLSCAEEELKRTLNSALTKARGTKVQIGLAPHSIYTLSKNALSLVAGLVRGEDLFLTIHLAESKAESEVIMHGGGPLRDFLSRYQLETVPPEGFGVSSVAYLGECGILKKRLVASHAVWVDDEDLKLLKKREIGVALCVRSNHFLKNGEAPVEKMRNQGVRFGIGTDSLASNSSLDLFEELRFIKSQYQEFSDEELLKMITINSAEILRMNEMIGSIEEGKQADLVVMKLKRVVDPSQVYQYLVDEGDKEDVLLSLVDGKVIFERGEA